MSLTPGVTFDRYRILSALGAGGMGEVFLAHDTRLHRRVALKLLHPADQAVSDRRRRFIQEARAASALTHPNIAVVYDIGEADGRHYIAMEHVEGRPLAEHLRPGPLSISDIIAIASQIADALQAAHAVGVVHRDVKPANVMITPATRVKVLDFGLAKITAITPWEGVANAQDETHTWATAPHVVMGTAGYMSPEQSLGRTIDHRTDIFSLGVLLYEAATGRHPFAGETIADTMNRLRHTDPDAVTSLNAGVPDEFDRIVMKCLAKDPARRYQSVGELLTDLRVLDRHDTVRATPIADRHQHNLPTDLTSFVGRQQDVETLVTLLTSARLITLTGSGGSGKTRLAQQVGARMIGTVAHGVWFVDLASTTDPDLLYNVIARVLDVPERPGVSVAETLVGWLRTHEVLLILDNCEHLVDACAAFAESALRQAAGLRILATSREALSVPGEAVWRVPSLPVPAPADRLSPDALLAFDAIRLFVDRAAAVAPFRLTGDNGDAVAEICRRLDGVPLAIELAAARTTLLSPSQIRDRLNDRFRLLAGGSRTQVARQRTLEATVEWSYELLADTERLLLMRLSIFSGGWSLDAAEQVCGGRGLDAGEVLDVLSRLADKSLVVVDDGGSERRYRLLETIRQYARHRLIHSADVTDVAHVHLDYFLALAREAEPKLVEATQVVWLDKLDVEHDNLSAAIEWSLGESDRRGDGLALAACLWWFWCKRGYLSEGFQRLERALNAQVERRLDVEARALVGLMHLASFRGDWNATRRLVERTLTLARTSGDLWAEAYALDHAALLSAEAGDFARCEEFARQARDLAARSTSPFAWLPLALATRLLGYQALRAGRLDEAGRLFEKVLKTQRKPGDVWSIGVLHTDLAGLRVIEGRYVEARQAAYQGLLNAQSIRDRNGVGWCLHTFAMLEAVAGRSRRAAWLFGAGEAVLESIGGAGQAHVTAVQDRHLAPAREALGDAVFRRIADEGRATPVARLMEIDPDTFFASAKALDVDT